MNKMFKTFKLGYSYKFASIIVEMILERGETWDNYFWINYSDTDEYFNELILENKDKILKPEKITLLHKFIEDVFEVYFYNEVYILKDNEYFDMDCNEIINFFNNTFINLLNEYNKKIKDVTAEIEKLDSKFENNKISENKYKEKIDNYIDYYLEKVELIKEQIAKETFYLLFTNKRFIAEFNSIVAEYICALDKEENKDIFTETDSVKRCTNLPQWLKKAVYFKCNGMCQKCGKDLSNKVYISEDKDLQYDHIVPLERGGINDPTNFQLLCKECNLHKSGKIDESEKFYQYFW